MRAVRPSTDGRGSEKLQEAIRVGDALSALPRKRSPPRFSGCGRGPVDPRSVSQRDASADSCTVRADLSERQDVAVDVSWSRCDAVP